MLDLNLPKFSTQQVDSAGSARTRQDWAVGLLNFKVTKTQTSFATRPAPKEGMKHLELRPEPWNESGDVWYVKLLQDVIKREAGQNVFQS